MNPIQQTYYIHLEGQLAEDALNPLALNIGPSLFEHYHEGDRSEESYFAVVFNDRHQAEAYQNYLTSLTFTPKEKLKVLEDFISKYFEVNDQHLACKHQDGEIPLSDLAPQRVHYIKTILRAKP